MSERLSLDSRAFYFLISAGFPLLSSLGLLRPVYASLESMYIFPNIFGVSLPFALAYRRKSPSKSWRTAHGVRHLSQVGVK